MPDNCLTLRLTAEFIAVFVLTPVALANDWIPQPWILPLLAIAILTALWLRRNVPGMQRFWRGDDSETERRQFRSIMIRWLYCSLLLTVAVIFLMPDRLFYLPRQNPRLWTLILVFYPILSVLPQEIIYRAFLLHRYARVFRQKRAYVLASALSFGWLHLIFGNFVAITLAVVGGWFFAQTYARTESLRLVSLEHTLYGMTIFTIGLGSFFYRRQVLGI